MQTERLQDEFMSALNSFQSVQRQAAAKEKEMVRKAKVSAGVVPFGEKKQETLIELQDSRTQKQIQQQNLQDEQNLRMLEEQEASIRQLEVDLFIHILLYIFTNSLLLSIYDVHVSPKKLMGHDR